MRHGTSGRFEASSVWKGIGWRDSRVEQEQVSAVPLIPERVTTRLWLIVTIDETVIELGLLFGFYRKRTGFLATSRAENAHAETGNCGSSD
ncbi:hypothetical protein RvY_12399 [Ramazzottius varieornatus]|uniref:Uncharacterized protein n=1 Tax=Ramazzottius varieornatus TaxID=947166 RepID=A0A1D1VT48_RAMVA|nr:hypothetical protein RvY_12399 [Ramazzottius varieornatus]